jgi:hypothetical protein
MSRGGGGSPKAWVRYRVLQSPTEEVISLTYENACFVLTVGCNLATFTFHQAPYNAHEAQELAEEFLGSWTADAILQSGGARRKFQVEGWHVGSDHAEAFLPAHLELAPEHSVAVGKLWRPWRHPELSNHPLLAGLVSRYEDCRRGRERPAVMGYFCLSVLEASFGPSRAAAAKALGIDRADLDKLGRLTSTVGSFQTARKGHPAIEGATELTESETFWIEKTVRLLIRNAAKVARARGG